MKLITANKLNRFWKNGILPELLKRIEKTKVLKSIEEIEANTSEENLAGATAVAELNNKLNGCSLEQEGNDFYIVGADAVRKKLGSPIVEISSMSANIGETPGTSGTINVGAGYKAAYIIAVWADFANSIGSGNTGRYGLSQSYNPTTGILSWYGLAPNVGGTMTIARIKVS